MTDLAAGDITYLFKTVDNDATTAGYGRFFLGRGQGFLSRGRISFGDGALTVPAGGVLLAKAKMGCPRICSSMNIIESSLLGYQFSYDISASRILIATGNNAVPVGTNATSLANRAVITGIIVDDATNGVAVNVVPIAYAQTASGGGEVGFLESQQAGDTDTTMTIGNGGPLVNVNDNDTPGGVQLYFDEDGTTEDKLIAINASLSDVFVPCDDGSMLKIKYDASANTNGVAVTYDDNASNSYEKLMAQTPSNTNATYTSALSAGEAGPITAVAQAFTGTAPTAATRLFEDAVLLAPAALVLQVETVGY